MSLKDFNLLLQLRPYSLKAKNPLLPYTYFNLAYVLGSLAATNLNLLKHKKKIMYLA